MSGYRATVAYIFWFFFGWFGLHHFYLRRDRHAFVWLCTLGGYLGIGWFAEVWRIKEYVRAANMELRYSSGEVPIPDPPHRGPPFKLKRFIGELLFGSTIGTLTIAALPEEVLSEYLWIGGILAIIGVALGVHTVANIGHEECSFKDCLLPAAILFPLYFFISKESVTNVFMWSNLCSAVYASKKARWRQVPGHRDHLCKRLVVFYACFAGFLVISGMAIYYNTYVTTDYGKRVPLRDALQNFFASEAWLEFRVTVRRLFRHLWNEGFTRFTEEFAIAMDPEGEMNAYRLLNLSWTASEKEIQSQYRIFSKRWHPDKFVNSNSEEEKLDAERRFVAIQQAYERISTIKARRMKKSEL